VFNGSASLRNAAGQLIESVNKSVRRGQNVDESYIDALYKEMTSLYRLDQTDENTEKLPTESVVLIATLVVCWLGMGIYVGLNKIKTKKQ
jgi:multiple sugar transport system substrate-binding protein